VQEATPEEKHLRVDMFIVDSRDAPGKSFPGDECSGGTFTGLFLAHDLRKKYKSHTNRSVFVHFLQVRHGAGQTSC